MGRPTISDTGPSSPKRCMGWDGVMSAVWKIPGFRSPSQKIVMPWTWAGIDSVAKLEGILRGGGESY